MRIWSFGAAGGLARRRSDLPDPPPRQWPRLWVPGVLVGTVTFVALLAIPSDSSAFDFLYLLAALIPLVLLLGATLMMGRGVRAVWWALFAFQILTMAAVGIFAVQSNMNGTKTFPSAADAVYLAAYIPAFIALGLLIHRVSPGRDRETWIDASILTVTAVSVFALFLISPILNSNDLSGVAALVAIAYPVLDLALLSALLWLLIGSTRPSPTLALISLSVAITLVADVVRDLSLVLQSLFSSADWVEALRVGALMVMAAAAWTPTAESIVTSVERTRERITTPRLAVLAIGVLTVPALVAMRLWGSTDDTTLLLALAGMIIIILAVWRIQILVSAVERQRRVTELVLDSGGDGIIGLDTNGLVLFANLSARRMLRCRESDLLGKRFHDVAHHEHADGTPFDWRECPVVAHSGSGEGVFIPDQHYLRRDGSVFPVEILMSPLIIDGAVVGAVQSFRDVSEREEMERLKRQFVSVVSHELRTPLTSIKGSLQMLDSGLMGDLSEDQQELVTMAVSNSERLGQLVNDILDFERLDAGRMPLEPVDVDAADLAHQAARGITGAADAAGVAIESSAPDGVDLTIHADPHRMLQVLTNLLGNAIKFSERGSAVQLSVLRVGSSVTFAVSDRGRGIPADQLSAVFERFGQVDAGDARRQGGTGLGLAIAREIVTRSGGTIEVASELGVGSTFTVVMPAVHDALQKEVAP